MMVGNNVYGNDPLREVSLNGNTLENKNEWMGDITNFISKLDELKEDNRFEIKYSSSERGVSAFKTVSECVFFEVSPDYPDLFFYEEKVKKMMSKKETEEI